MNFCVTTVIVPIRHEHRRLLSRTILMMGSMTKLKSF